MSNQSGSADQTTDGVGSSENQNEVNLRDRSERDLFKWKAQAKELEKKAQDLEAKLRERELEEEEKKGNLTKVLDEYKEKNRLLETTLKQKDFAFARNNIISNVKQEAIKAGCKDPDAFVRLLGKEKIDLVSVDESYNPSLDDVKSILNEGMKTYEHIGLFGKSVNMVNGLPTKDPNVTVKKKPMSEMSKEELIALAKSMK